MKNCKFGNRNVLRLNLRKMNNIKTKVYFNCTTLFFNYIKKLILSEL